VRQSVKEDHYVFNRGKVSARKPYTRPSSQKLNKFSKSYRRKPYNRVFSKKTFIKFKPLKKFRFWREYKRMFLFKKRKFTFFKVNLLFNSKRLIKHQFKFLFGYPLNRLGYTPSSKYAFTNSNFFDYCIILESLLSILLVRIKFYSIIYNSVKNIKEKRISVNGNIIINPKYRLSPFDIIQKCRIKNVWKKRLKFKKHLWRWYRWRQASYLLKKVYKQKRYNNIYWLSKKVLYLII